MMVSSNTLHVVSTEVTVGSFAMAGLAFMLAGLASHDLLERRRWLPLADHVGHFALAFGMLAMPVAILTGIASSPGEGVDHPVLINKMFLASTSFGLALGVVLVRWRHGSVLWENEWSKRWQSLGGMMAAGLTLLTASLGGTFARGESLLDMLHLPYDQVPLMPVLLSMVLIVAALGNLWVARSEA